MVFYGIEKKWKEILREVLKEILKERESVMDIVNKDIDGGKAFDWGKASELGLLLQNRKFPNGNRSIQNYLVKLRLPSLIFCIMEQLPN